MGGIDIEALSSEELATRFAETREEAYFAEIVRRHKRKICVIAYRVLGDFGKAEDVAQESFLLLSMAGNRFKVGNVEGWLSLVARRLAINVRKRLDRQDTVEERFVQETLQNSHLAGTPDPQILATLGQLSPQERICLNLFYGEGLSYKEIIEKSGFTMNQVKAHLQSGRRNFKKHWDRRDRNGE